MTLDQVKKLVETIAAKSNLSGYLSPEDFNHLIRKCSMDRFNALYKVYEETQKVSDDLRPFVITDPDHRTIGSDNYTDLPSDYIHLSSVKVYKVTNVEGSCVPSEHSRPAEVLTDDQWNYRTSSTLKTPSERHPISTIENNKLKVLPSQFGFCRLSYIRKPADPVYDFNLSATAGAQYLPPGSTHDGTNPNFSSGDASTSVELDWPEQAQWDVAARLLKQLGVSVRSELLIQTAEEIGV